LGSARGENIIVMSLDLIATEGGADDLFQRFEGLLYKPERPSGAESVPYLLFDHLEGQSREPIVLMEQGKCEVSNCHR
jgi:hypothetical protein